MITTFFELTFLFFSSLTTMFVMRKVAKKIGLVDKPNNRKTHQGDIPLVGGISIGISLAYFFLNNLDILPNTTLYVVCLTLLIVIGALDDKFDISFKVRFAFQALISIAMMILGELKLQTIGDIFGIGEIITFGWFGYVVTILAVVGAINAYNMVDGIDGLLGGLSVVTFGALAILMVCDNQYDIAYVCLVLVVATIPYILLNLGVLGRRYKVFMGDAGSMFIGFSVIWLLLLSSQKGSHPPLQPVTALWLIAVPLMDMAAIMIRRIRRGDSPFKPDRDHLHHIMQRLGFNSHQTLLAICTIASLFAGVGIYSESANIPEYIMFYVFLACFAVYVTFLSNIWRITTALRRWKVNRNRSSTAN